MSCCVFLEAAHHESGGEEVTVFNKRPLRPGDIVEVRSASEILATLDADASVDAMPFMPEMLKYVGQRFTVSRRVDKICNNVDDSCSPSRRMHSTVHLEDLRCDGSGHDGCQLGCRLYWKEEWLRRTDERATQIEREGEDLAALETLAQSAARSARDLDGDLVQTYRCQATEAIAASESLNQYDPRQYILEVAGGNVSAGRLIAVLAHAIWSKTLRVLRIRQPLPVKLPDRETSIDTAALGLKPGDVVQVRSMDEIAETLNRRALNRGLSFTPEMSRYCGRTLRVRERVERLIDERTGKMIEISRDCVTLDGAICPGEGGQFAFLFCPRGTFGFWREGWLHRVDADERIDFDASRGQGS